MTDNPRDDVAPITLSEHSRLLIASHRLRIHAERGDCPEPPRHDHGTPVKPLGSVMTWPVRWPRRR
jgi:hypothetical protein